MEVTKTSSNMVNITNLPIGLADFFAKACKAQTLVHDQYKDKTPKEMIDIFSKLDDATLNSQGFDSKIINLIRMGDPTNPDFINLVAQMKAEFKNGIEQVFLQTAAIINSAIYTLPTMPKQ